MVAKKAAVRLSLSELSLARLNDVISNVRQTAEVVILDDAVMEISPAPVEAGRGQFAL